MKTLSLLVTSLLLGGTALFAGDKHMEAQASGDLSASEVKFVMKAAEAGKTEAALGELAKTGGDRADVKDFGKMMADDHGAANTKLAAIAEKNKVTLPEPGKKEEESMAKLSKLKGAEFDAAYLDEMVTAHEKAVKLFKTAQGTVKNEELKAFVDNTLPTLEKHLEKVKELNTAKAKESAKTQS